MRAADQWARMEIELGPDWDDAHLSFTPEGSTADAAAILAPLAPGRVGRELRFHVTRDGSSRERLRNLLSRLDSKRAWGTLSLIESTPPMPAAVAVPSALRFRVSGKQGYGVPPGMARRCFERMDADGITGWISLLGELSDTENADTQGPVWRVAGRSV